MGKLLVKFAHDWADEFDVYGLLIVEESEWLEKKENLPNVEWYFGTNEGYEQGDLSADYGFTTTKITDAEIEVLATLIPFRKRSGSETGMVWGNFPPLIADEEDD